MNKNLKGTIMVLMAGIAWGISGISGQYLMAHGMNINLLTSVRLIVPGLLLTAMAVISQPQHFSCDKTAESSWWYRCICHYWAFDESICVFDGNSLHECWYGNGFTVCGTDYHFGLCIVEK